MMLEDFKCKVKLLPGLIAGWAVGVWTEDTQVIEMAGSSYFDSVKKCEDLVAKQVAYNVGVWTEDTQVIGTTYLSCFDSVNGCEDLVVKPGVCNISD